MKPYKNLLIDYFNFFSKKDLKNLTNMFSSDVKLFDWEISALGIDEVVTANENIFNSVDTIEVFLKNIYKNEINNSFVCEIEIKINNDNVLKVIDIISFDEKNKINLISAYKQ